MVRRLDCMEPSDAIPWVWCAATLAAAWRTRRRTAGWWLAGGGALVLASVHLWGWNKPVYHAGREVLIAFGVHDDRLVFKFAIAVVFVPVVAWFAFRAWRWSRRLAPLHRVALGLMAVDALYVTVRTLSIDGWMPLAIGLEPGKSVLGLTLAALAFLGVVFAGPPPEVDDDEI